MTVNKVKWVPLVRQKIKPEFHYQQGHPGGYTDDLGIIADTNQYVREELPGWRSEVDPQDYYAMRQWCEQNLEHGTWYTGVYYLVLSKEKDVSWFMLRWS